MDSNQKKELNEAKDLISKTKQSLEEIENEQLASSNLLNNSNLIDSNFKDNSHNESKNCDNLDINNEFISEIDKLSLSLGEIEENTSKESSDSSKAIETILVTTDAYDEIKKINSLPESLNPINEIQESVGNVDKIANDVDIPTTNSDPNLLENISETNEEIAEEEYWRNKDWVTKERHIFVLSSAGKPIYSRYGNEDKLSTLFGVMQALVSFVESENDSLRSLHAGDTKFVFLVKGPLTLVCISKFDDNVNFIRLQLTYVFNQICSVLTLTQLNRIFEQRKNYDLRRLLSGSERLIDHLINFTETESAFIVGAIKCLPLRSSIRDTITQTIINACSKIKNLVFAILIANNELITLVRMKKYMIHPFDLHLIFNLVNSSESFKSAESWTPICLPKFDSSGFLHTHVSYLADDCQACLLLLTVDHDIFFLLSEAKQKIVDKLRRTNCLEAINDSMNRKKIITSPCELNEIRHFIYKSKTTAQFYSPELRPPYAAIEKERKRLFAMYINIHDKLHGTLRPLKLIFQRLHKEVTFGWITNDCELYIIFDPLVDYSNVINSVDKLLKWIKKEEDKLFIMNAPTF